MATVELQGTTGAINADGEEAQVQDSSQLSHTERSAFLSAKAYNHTDFHDALLALSRDIEARSDDFVELVKRKSQLDSIDEPLPMPASSAADSFKHADFCRGENSCEEGAKEIAPLSKAELDALLADNSVDTSLGLGPDPKTPHWMYGDDNSTLPTVFLGKAVRKPRTKVAARPVTLLVLSDSIPRPRPASSKEEDVPTNASKRTPKRKAKDDGKAVGSKTKTKRARVSKPSARTRNTALMATAAALSASNATTVAASQPVLPEAPTLPASTSIVPAPTPTAPTATTPAIHPAPANSTTQATIHGDEPLKDPRPHKCSHADCKYHTLGFERAEHKTRHEKSIHQKVIIVTCRGCRKEFSRVDNLRPHLAKCAGLKKLFPMAPAAS